jgi:hypothetical protein
MTGGLAAYTHRKHHLLADLGVLTSLSSRHHHLYQPLTNLLLPTFYINKGVQYSEWQLERISCLLVKNMGRIKIRRPAAKTVEVEPVVVEEVKREDTAPFEPVVEPEVSSSSEDGPSRYMGAFTTQPVQRRPDPPPPSPVPSTPTPTQPRIAAPMRDTVPQRHEQPRHGPRPDAMYRHGYDNHRRMMSIPVDRHAELRSRGMSDGKLRYRSHYGRGHEYMTLEEKSHALYRNCFDY